MLISFSAIPGKYEAKVPVIINDDYNNPYVYITMVGELKAPRVWFDPLALVMTPVPLDTEITMDFQILCADYAK